MSSICLEINGSKNITEISVPKAVTAGDDKRIVALQSEKMNESIDTKNIPLEANKNDMKPRTITLFFEKDWSLNKVPSLIVTESRPDNLS